MTIFTNLNGGSTIDNEHVSCYVEILHSELLLIANQLTAVSESTKAHLQYALQAMENAITGIEIEMEEENHDEN
jgi:hypothetical protein